MTRPDRFVLCGFIVLPVANRKGRRAVSNKTTLRIHQFLPKSKANGPGNRAVLWVQGCTLGCPGCFNAPTHLTQAGVDESVDIIFERILALGSNIEGITISGGEPLQQQTGIASLLRRVKAETKLSVVLFTGFSWEELERMGEADRQRAGADISTALPLPLLADVDVLLAGRYDAGRRIARGLLGSDNKIAYFLTTRYNQADLDRVPKVEVIVTPQGRVFTTGIDPVHLEGL